MPNVSLENWLYKEDRHLNLHQRVTVMLDAAMAVEYLHHGHVTPIVHCDLKTGNVLLDEDMVAHVSDFGISKIFAMSKSMAYTETLGTLGYIAPDEEICNENLDLRKWITQSFSEEEQITCKSEMCIASMIELGLDCTKEMPESRITMTDVVKRLNKIKNAFLEIENLFSHALFTQLHSRKAKRVAIFIDNNVINDPEEEVTLISYSQQLDFGEPLLHDNQLTNELREHELRFFNSLANCRMLRYLQVGNNPLNGTLPNSTRNLSSTIENFNIVDAHINGLIPTSIGNMSGLTVLSLGKNNLMGNTPPEIEGEISGDGVFANSTLQSFLGNKGLCGMHILEIPACAITYPGKQSKLREKKGKSKDVEKAHYLVKLQWPLRFWIWKMGKYAREPLFCDICPMGVFEEWLYKEVYNLNLSFSTPERNSPFWQLQQQNRCPDHS
ncbi:hypothetical protein H5410_020469 [Solanum commersonii]|uniref:Protein kinase domain-containing protein n=1 Tax=Solanum commersonii TaxID=4109 RepID=A0A9J5ZCH8_SOLCO|nr:hypothetical protein H5410_020469 [Solanum commersonii]